MFFLTTFSTHLRYQKCLHCGMKREAVQEERQRTKERNENEVESTSSNGISSGGGGGLISGSSISGSSGGGLPLGPSNAVNSTSPTGPSSSSSNTTSSSISIHHQQQQLNQPNQIGLLSSSAPSSLSALNISPNYSHEALLAAINEAEMRIDVRLKRERAADITSAVRTQIKQMFEWAKAVPHFTDLYLEDQCSLVKAGWNELLIAQFAHRSIEAHSNVLVLSNGLYINDQGAASTGIGEIFSRVLTELVSKMREMAMDKTELGCLRAVVLFNPGKWFYKI